MEEVNRDKSGTSLRPLFSCRHLVRTHLDEYTYVDQRGNLFQVRTTDIVGTAPAPLSIMPTGMVDLLTDRELRDVLAYLGERR